MAAKSWPSIFNSAKYRHTIHIVGCLIAIFCLISIKTQITRGSAGAYDASGLLGQFQATDTGTPDFTAYFTSPVSTSVVIDPVDHRMFVGKGYNNQGASQIYVYNLNPSTNILEDKVPDAFLALKSNTVDAVSISQSYGVYGLAYDEVGKRLFASDPGNNRVLVYDVASITDNEPAISVLGQADFTSSAIADLRFPTSLAYDPVDDMLYVSVPAANGTVDVFDVASITDGEARVHFLGQAATNAGKFQYPAGMALDDSRHLFVNDYGNYRVLVFDIASISNSEDAINVIGQPNLTTVTTGCLQYSATSVCVDNSPYTNVAFDPARHYLYVGMNYRVLVFDIATLSNNPSAINVLGQPDFVSNNSVFQGVTATSLGQIFSLAYDPVSLRLYTVDIGFRIGIFDLTTITDNEPMVDLLGQQNVFTYGDLNSPLFNQSGIYSNSVPNGAGFNKPTHVAIDPNGHKLFVLDSNVYPYNPRILVFDLDTNNNLVDNIADAVIGVVAPNNQYTYGSFGFYFPYSMTFDPDTNFLYFTDSTSFYTLFGVDVSTVDQHDDVAVTVGDGSLQFFDSVYDSVHKRLFSIMGSDIVVYDLSDGLSDAELPEYTLGQGAMAQTPDSLGYDSVHDRLFVADTGNNRVNIYDFGVTPIGDGVNPSNVLGAPDLSTAGNYGSTVNTFSFSPGATGFSYDEEADQLFVTDGINNRILIFDTETITDGEDAVAVIGQAQFTGSSAVASRDGLASPVDMTFDAGNRRLYVADSLNNRVLFYNLLNLKGATFSDATENAPYTSPALEANNGQGTVTFQVVSGSLPAGLTLDASTGVVSGTPTASSAGQYNFTIEANNEYGESNLRSNKVAYTITVVAAPGGGGGGGGGGGSIPLCNDTHANNFGSQNSCEYDPPNLTILNPISSGTYTSGAQTVAVDGIASDRDTIVSIEYSLNGALPLLATGTTSWTIPPLVLLPGPNTLTVTAKNNHNLQTIRTLTLVYSTPPPDPCEVNPALPGCGEVITPPDTTCHEPAATNYNQEGPCVYPQPTDLCLNITGLQTSVPAGYQAVSGVCTLIPIIEDPVIPPGDGGGGGVITPPTEPQVEGVSTDGIRPIGWLGLIVGLVTTLLGAFGGALALSEIVFIPARIWQLLLGFLGFKKKVRHWGVIYDGVTKQPLDPAYVSLYDVNGKEVATAITDLEGRYGFLVQPGSYRIVANKTNYIFPSRKMAGKTSDEIYADLYFGDYFEVKAEGDLIMKNIPMDPEHFDWNEYIKHEKKLVKGEARRARVMATISNILFYGGFMASVVAYYFDHSTFNIAMIGVYILLFILRQFIIKKPSYGAVSASGDPLSFGVVKMYSAKLGTLMSTKVLDKYGRYYMIAPKGSYYAVVQEKKEDQSYQNLHQTNPFTATGVINKKFKI